MVIILVMRGLKHVEIMQMGVKCTNTIINVCTTCTVKRHKNHKEIKTAVFHCAHLFVCLWSYDYDDDDDDDDDDDITVVLKVTFANNILLTGISTSTHTHTLVGVLGSVLHDGHQSQPSLLGGGDDLIGWQDEAVAAGVPQLEGVGVLDALVVGPVNGATTSLVYNQKTGSVQCIFL